MMALADFACELPDLAGGDLWKERSQPHIF
jgi:hypothetical protein